MSHACNVVCQAFESLHSKTGMYIQQVILNLSIAQFINGLVDANAGMKPVAEVQQPSGAICFCLQLGLLLDVTPSMSLLGEARCSHSVFAQGQYKLVQI